MGVHHQIGRDSVVADLKHALSEPQSRCILVGEAGLGKSTVLDAVVDALEPTMAIVRCAAIEVENSLGLSVAADAAAAVLELEPDITAADASVLTALIDPAPGEPDLDARTVAVALGRSLAALNTEKPVLLVLDDLHWVDTQSAAILSLALRRALEADLRVLAATRGAVPLPIPDAIIMPLPALDRAPLAEMVSQRVDIRLTPHVAMTLLSAAGGNPLLALEIARSLPPDATEADVQLPVSLADRVATRLRSLPVTCRDALLDVAVRGTCSWDDFADGQLITPAIDAGVIRSDRGRLRFEHPLFLRGTLDTAPPDSIERAHLRAAESTTDPLVRAWHLAQGPSERDDSRASELEGAAQQFLRRGDLVTAEYVARAAVTASPPTTESSVLWRRQYLRAQALQPMGPVPAELLAELRSVAHSADEKALSELVAARSVSEQLQILRVDTDELSVPVRLWMAGQLLTATLLTGDHRVGVQAVAPFVPARAPEGAKDEWAEVASALQLMNRVSGLPVDIDVLDEAVAIASRAGSPDDVELGQGPRAIRGLIAMYDDDHDVARELLTRPAGAAPDSPSAQVFHSIEFWCRVGEVTRARELVDNLVGWYTDPSFAYAYTLVAAWEGDVERCRIDAARSFALSLEADDVMFPVATQTALAIAELGRGDRDQAWQLSSAAASALNDRGWVEPSIFPALPIAVEAALWTGRTQEADDLLSILEAHADQVGSRWGSASAARCQGLRAVMAGELETGLDLLAASATQFQSLGLPTEHGRTLLVAGQLERRANLRQIAAGHLQRAVELFSAAGARGFAEQAEAELRRCGKVRTSATELTESERQVAELVAQGSSNAQVAAALFLSVKTVETHLSRVYRKVGVRSRSELAAQWSSEGFA